jgi:nucleotide-binding universal stress UspA family protein
MTTTRSVLAPVDFSDASRGALRYASAAANYLQAELVVLTVTDPLLTEAAELSGQLEGLPDAISKELRRFTDKTFDGVDAPHTVRYELASGKPAVEILRIAKSTPTSLVVMSTHGLTGVRKLFFGSTTERVLRETTVPVLLTPAHDHGPARPEDVKKAVKRILVPVDLSPATRDQVMSAGRLATALELPVLLAHVVEPVHFAAFDMPHLPNLEVERRSRAEKALAELAASLGPTLRVEALVAYGDPAEEIAKVARDRDTGLIVIGLHATSILGPRMGSVTYRVLCLTAMLVLALPPKH